MLYEQFRKSFSITETDAMSYQGIGKSIFSETFSFFSYYISTLRCFAYSCTKVEAMSAKMDIPGQAEQNLQVLNFMTSSMNSYDKVKKFTLKKKKKTHLYRNNSWDL